METNLTEHPILSTTKCNILKVSEYYQRFFELSPYFKTYRAAWEHLESEMEFKYRMNRYSSYESFISAKNRYLRTRLKKCNNVS